MIKVWISGEIANEYIGRLVFPFARRAGTVNVTLEQARELWEDARFNADRRNGPEEMPSGTRRAYAALEQRLSFDLAAYEPYEPPAAVQGETSRGEPRAYWPELRPETSQAQLSIFDVVPDEREVLSPAAVRRQVDRFNNTIGLFAALQLWHDRAA